MSHNQTKLLTALQVKKYRQKYRKFTVEGEKMAAELLAQQRVGVSAIFGLERWAADNAALLQPYLEKFNPVSEAELKKISALTTPNKVLVVAELPDEPFDPAIFQRDFCFFLDGIQDPGNLGAILRVADWFGIPAVGCSPDSADAFSPKVVQASMGAFLRVKIWEMPLEDVLEIMPDLPVLGAVLGGNNVFQAELPTKGLVVIGSEGRGISPAAEARLTHRLTIPRHPSGGAESLNAAVAAGIVAAIIRNH
ncbi:MAG: RNA methyltransferase [Haliscomenobacteraceae bacterium CHB4]|nr:RNA methyltransferase [Haliscomenobacteraceae bacterium CHB4]